MSRGLDTTRDLTLYATAIKAANYDFVARYLSQSHWKVVGEARAIEAAGLALVLVYEDCPTTSDYFSLGRGQADGIRAAQQALLIGAPTGTVLYFAVDYDASTKDIGGAVTQYFGGVTGALKSFATANRRSYSAGVYGSGATCVGIVAADLAKRGWLAQSPGWRGYGTYKDWSIRQGMPSVLVGLSVDPDEATGEPGAVRPSTSRSRGTTLSSISVTGRRRKESSSRKPRRPSR
jgi:hypothetical protein